MNIPRPVRWLALATLLISCSSSTSRPATDGPPKKIDDAIDGAISPDAGADTAPSPKDLAVASDLAAEASVDVGVDKGPPISDTPIAVEVGTEAGSSEVAPLGDVDTTDGAGPDKAQTCFWQSSGGGYSLKHFSFLLTTPDGQAQSPPSYYSAQDAGAWQINDFEGQVESESGNLLTVDGCVAPAPCLPALYRFTLCDSLQGACKAGDSQAAIQLGIPLGRRVRVVWHMDNDVPGFCPGLFWLAIYDAEPGATQGNLLFVGSGGRQPNATGPSPSPLGDLPFSVNLRALSCGGTARDGSFSMADDYAFLFSPKSGAGTTLQVATGETGPFEFTTQSGGTQRLQVHCLDAVQPGHTDDYWNWDFWAISDTVASPPSPMDAGGN